MTGGVRSHSLERSELSDTPVRSSSPSNLDRDPEEIGVILSRISIALFVIFAAVVISTALPPRLLNPTWQLRLIAALVNNGTLALLAFVLMWVATAISPASGRLRARRDQFAAFAVAAALGYLLLIPLQGYAAWKGLNTAKSAQAQQLKAAKQRIGQIRAAISQSRTTAELQSRLQVLRGPSLPTPELSRPIEAIRPQILAGLEGAESRLRQQLGGLPPDRVWQLVQESIRVAITALAYALAYASGAFMPGQPLSLLDTWTERFRGALRRAPGKKKGSGRGSILSNEEYLRELSREETPDQER